MFTPFLYGTLAAAAVAGIVLLAARGRAPSAVAVGMAYAAGQATVFGWPSYPIADTTHWLFWTGVAAAAAEVPECAWPASKPARWIPRLVLPPLVVFLSARPRIQWAWTTGEAVAAVAGLGAAMAVFSLAVSSLERRGPGAAFPFGLAAAAGALAALLAGTGSLLLAALAAGLAAALGVRWAAARWLGPGRVPRTGALAPSLLLGALWLHGRLYAETPAWTGAFFAAAPALALWVAWRAGRQR